jgi:NAD-dependent SIR2 family protein deacetylase
MYIGVEQHFKCSKCMAVDNYETVTRRNKTYRRCCDCGHEKLISEMFTASTTDSRKYTLVHPENWIDDLIEF